MSNLEENNRAEDQENPVIQENQESEAQETGETGQMPEAALPDGAPSAEDGKKEAPEAASGETPAETSAERTDGEETPAETPDEEDEEDGTFILNDEEGNEYPVTLLDYVDYKDKLYALLAPEGADLDDEEEELSIMVMEVTLENEEVTFNLVEDEPLALAVIDAFTKKVIEEEE